MNGTIACLEIEYAERIKIVRTFALILFAIVAFSGLSYAGACYETGTCVSPGFFLDNLNGGNTDSHPAGMRVLIGDRALNLTRICRHIGSPEGGISAYVADTCSGGTCNMLTAGAVFDGDCANVPYTLTNNTYYWFVIWNGGADYGHHINSTNGGSFPLNGTNATLMTWVNSTYATSINTYGIVEIENVSVIYAYNTTPSLLSITQLSPADNATLVDNRVSHVFNVNASTGNFTVNFYLDGALNATYTQTTNITYNITYNMSEASHSWYIFAYNTTNISQNTTSPSRTYTLPFVNLTDCAVGGSQVINFTFFSQDALTTPVNSTMSATFTIYATNLSTRNYSFNFSTPKSTITLCLNYNNTNFTLDSTQTFTAAGYQTLYYYLLNQTINTNNVVSVPLYNLNSTGSVATQYLVYSGASQPVPNAYVQIQRYYPSTGQLVLISMGKTNTNGVATSYAVANNVIYRYVIIENNQITFTSGTSNLPCDPSYTLCPTTIYVSSGIQNEYAAYVNAVGVGCVYDGNITVYCTSNNPGGTGTALNLKVYQIGTYSNTLVCDQSMAAGSGTVICTLPDATKAYYYVGKATIGSDIIIGQGNINMKIIGKIDQTIGLFGTMLLVVGVGLMGITFGFSGGIIGVVFGLILSVILQLITIELSFLVPIVAIAIVLAWVLRG